MWEDYEASYRLALEDPEFLAWRASGARNKALNIVRVCRQIKAGSVIEIGCGTGAVLRVLHDMRFADKYCCIDLSLSAVTYTSKSCPAFAGRAAVGGATALPFRDKAFDVAILSHVLEHLDDPAPALREASRVARFVVVEAPTEKVFSNFVRTKIIRFPYASIASAGHVQFWSPVSIARFLTDDVRVEILDRHLDLLHEDTVPQGQNAAGPKAWLKRALKTTLKNTLPPPFYSRLLTTHAVFLCRR